MIIKKKINIKLIYCNLFFKPLQTQNNFEEIKPIAQNRKQS